MPRPSCSLGFMLGQGLALLSTLAVAFQASAQCQILPPNHIFNTRIDSLPAASDQTPISTLKGATLHMDLGNSVDPNSADYYGIPFNIVDSNNIVPVPIGYSSDNNAGDDAPDESNCPISNDGKTYVWRNMSTSCSSGDDNDGNPLPLANAVLPIPPAGVVLIESGLQTPASETANYSDAHMLLADAATCYLWEGYFSIYQSPASPPWTFGSTAMWDLSSTDLRPSGWTSADVAGFPIYPLLAKEAEAASGTIKHAFRFTGTENGQLVWPATHLGGNQGAGFPNGMLIRLKSSYKISSSASTQLRAILTAMQQYGLYFADGGGNLFVQGEPNANWADDVPGDGGHPDASSFEVVDISSITGAAGWSATSAAVPASLNLPQGGALMGPLTYVGTAGSSTGGGGTTSGGTNGGNGGGGSSGTSGPAGTSGPNEAPTTTSGSHSVRGSCRNVGDGDLAWLAVVLLLTCARNTRSRSESDHKAN